jgi:hypothetical protein
MTDPKRGSLSEKGNEWWDSQQKLSFSLECDQQDKSNVMFFVV